MGQRRYKFFTNLNEKINGIIQGYTVKLFEEVNLPQIMDYLAQRMVRDAGGQT